MKKVLLLLLLASPAWAQVPAVINPPPVPACTDGQVLVMTTSGTVWACGTTGGTGTVTTGSALTVGTIPKASGAAALVNSIITESGATITVTGTMNATVGFNINGTTINTCGILTNIPCLSGANVFTNAAPIEMSGATAVMSFSSSTGTKKITTGGTTNLNLDPGSDTVLINGGVGGIGFWDTQEFNGTFIWRKQSTAVTKMSLTDAGLLSLDAITATSSISVTGGGVSTTGASGIIFISNGRLSTTNGDGLFLFRDSTVANGVTLDVITLDGTAHFKTRATTDAAIVRASSFKAGGSAVRGTTEGTNQLVLFNGTAPAGTLTDGVTFYSAAGEARVMDAAGNSSLLSPHDQQTNDWIFHSKNTLTGKVLRIDMERLMRRLDQQYGGGYVTDTVEPIVTDAEKQAQAARSVSAVAEQKEQQRVADAETKLTECIELSEIVVKQGGKQLDCTPDGESKKLKARRDVRIQQERDEVAQREKNALARCAARNAIIVKQGGKSVVCGGVQ